jgi:ABC-type bacteriocin/lantibiotic exporter with double-glycine peptidase domain
MKKRFADINISEIPSAHWTRDFGIAGDYSIKRVDLARINEYEDASTTEVRQECSLILIRGLPGTGKSTLAKALAIVGYRHFEADMFSEDQKTKRIDLRRLREAHALCLQHARRSLKLGSRVVVANTFVRPIELLPYIELMRCAIVVETNGPWESIHDVPQKTLQRYRDEWLDMSEHAFSQRASHGSKRAKH